MRRSQRLIAAAVLIALSGALAGCSGSMSSFDPTDLLDFLDTKKKLPGERKPVFPEGVPGLEQGVPKDLYKGSAQEQLDQQNAAAARRCCRPPRSRNRSTRQIARASSRRRPARTPRRMRLPPMPTPRPRKRAAPPPRRRRPKPTKIVRRRTTAPPPRSAAQPAAAGATGAADPQHPAATPFPAPLPSGTFTR